MMRTASQKLAIIRLVEDSELSVRRTLDEIKQENPTSELFFLMGADSLHDFPTWREPERILELSTVVAVNRPGQPTPEGLKNELGSLDMSRIQLLSMPGIDISATELRSRVRDRRGLRFLTPRAVEGFLTEHKLYDEFV